MPHPARSGHSSHSLRQPRQPNPCVPPYLTACSHAPPTSLWQVQAQQQGGSAAPLLPRPPSCQSHCRSLACLSTRRRRRRRRDRLAHNAQAPPLAPRPSRPSCSSSGSRADRLHPLTMPGFSRRPASQRHRYRPACRSARRRRRRDCLARHRCPWRRARRDPPAAPGAAPWRIDCPPHHAQLLQPPHLSAAPPKSRLLPRPSPPPPLLPSGPPLPLFAPRPLLACSRAVGPRCGCC